MKKLGYITIMLLVFVSCNNSYNKQRNNSYNDNSLSIVDSISNDLNIIDKQDKIPIGYTREAFQEYAPQNNIEKKFLSDMRSFSDAINSKNSKRVVELYYPDYFIMLQKQVPEKSIKQIKDKVQSYYEVNFDEIIKTNTKDWNEAKRAGVCITNIMNRVSENGKMLYLYEYHTTLSSDKETIYKKEAEYSVGASLNNGKQWHSSADNISDIFELLSISFSRSAIEKVLTKQ